MATLLFSPPPPSRSIRDYPGCSSAPRSPVCKDRPSNSSNNNSNSGKDVDLYAAVSKDFNLNRCLPRWPAECQVRQRCHTAKIDARTDLLILS